jgi:hypothetical protein
MSVAEFNVTMPKLFYGVPYCLDHMSVLAHGKSPDGSWTAKLDVIKLDDWLIRRHGDYDGSMRDRVRQLFGDAAVTFIENTL